jgi:hypothetical protein
MDGWMDGWREGGRDAPSGMGSSIGDGICGSGSGSGSGSESGEGQVNSFQVRSAQVSSGQVGSAQLLHLDKSICLSICISPSHWIRTFRSIYTYTASVLQLEYVLDYTTLHYTTLAFSLALSR